MILYPSSAAEVQEAVRAHPRVAARGGGTKPALSRAPEGALLLEMSGLRGIVEYEPDEYTFTALAGTPVAEVQRELAGKGQYLPFDPLFAEEGATLGGTVAANTSGPGRYRYGGVRDFLLGVRFVDGDGSLVRGGGKVVKNAAGFDLPKLMVGSLGHYGILVEVTFKVFPEPPAYATLRAELETLDAALAAIGRLATSPLELYALELEPPGVLWLRVGGLGGVMDARLAALRDLVGTGEVIEGEDAFWREARSLGWASGAPLLAKAPVTPGAIPALDAHLAAHGAARRYSAGGNAAWIGWPGEAAALATLLREAALPGLVLRGESEAPLIGHYPGNLFARRVRGALDPQGRFAGV